MVKSTLTPAEIAKRWRISPDKVRSWIQAGELAAINVAKNVGGRPRYRVDEADFVAFENRRRVQPRSYKPHRRRKQMGQNTVEFF
jgi:excisionase family DNA binding protein